MGLLKHKILTHLLMVGAVVFMSATTGMAEIRRYNPVTGTITEITPQGGGVQTTVPQVVEPSRDNPNITIHRGEESSGQIGGVRRAPTVQVRQGGQSLSQGAMQMQEEASNRIADQQRVENEALNPPPPYGYVVALIDRDNYEKKRVFDNLVELQETKGILFKTYIKEEEGAKDPEKAAQSMPLPKWMMNYKGESPAFRFDKNNRLAKLYQVKDQDYPVIIYQDPRGERRYFSIASSIDGFLTKYNQVRQEVGNNR